ncbi:hypothetical protein [Modestobacter sp. SYSU DS0875]
MSAPHHRPTDRRDARRPWLAGGLVLLLVVAVTAGALALRPRQVTAAAGLTVTPRTETGAAAAVLVADRYAALATAPETVRAAAGSDAALADVPLADLRAGLAVERVGDAATITVRSTLPDRADAVRAADAVVDVLVAEGRSEELVDVARVSTAAPERAGRSGTGRWLLVGLLTGIALGLATTALTAGRRGPAGRTTGSDAGGTVSGGRGSGDTAPTTGPPDGVVDDLPGFLDRPPGSPAPPTAPRSGSSASTATAVPAGTAGRPGGRGTQAATAGAVVLLLGAAVLAGTGPTDTTAPATAARSIPLGPPPESGPTRSPEPPSADPAAGSLAFRSVLPGGDGLVLRAAFTGLLLEERAVGLTVTTPSLSVSTDGERALAHVRLPVWNCLTAEPPADPAAAGCARGRTEYADLADPGLQVRRDGDRVELTGLFPTYTRPNGSAPTYTGRAYRLTATLTADGGVGDGRAAATGVLQLGLDSAPVSPAPGVSQLLLPG